MPEILPPTAFDELNAAIAKSKQLARDMAAIQERIAELAKKVAENGKHGDKKPSGVTRPS
jgi:hypothetical protein